MSRRYWPRQHSGGPAGVLVGSLRGASPPWHLLQRPGWVPPMALAGGSRVALRLPSHGASSHCVLRSGSAQPTDNICFRAISTSPAVLCQALQRSTLDVCCPSSPEGKMLLEGVQPEKCHFKQDPRACHQTPQGSRKGQKGGFCSQEGGFCSQEGGFCSQEGKADRASSLGSHQQVHAALQSQPSSSRSPIHLPLMCLQCDGNAWPSDLSSLPLSHVPAGKGGSVRLAGRRRPQELRAPGSCGTAQLPFLGFGFWV